MISRQRKIVYLFVATAIMAVSTTQQAGASAFAGYLTAFGDTYPDSTANNANCQLCHQGQYGGSPWNAYGWAIRQQIKDNGLSITEAILAVEELDSDGSGVSNLDEIMGNGQPGWTTGDTNTVTNREGVEIQGISAPAIDILDVTATSVSTTMNQATSQQLIVLLVSAMVIILTAVTMRSARD